MNVFSTIGDIPLFELRPQLNCLRQTDMSTPELFHFRNASADFSQKKIKIGIVNVVNVFVLAYNCGINIKNEIFISGLFNYTSGIDMRSCYQTVLGICPLS